jgi:lambda repressor-like predicted transcriptional regulator
MSISIDGRIGGVGAGVDFESMRARFQTINTTAASYLGIDETTLRSELEAGKSLADIATEQGKSVDGLKTALTSALSSSASADGRDLDALVDRLVERHRGERPEGGPIGARPDFDTVEQALTEYLGIDASTLRTEIQSGKSLASIATEAGKSVDDLKSTLRDALSGVASDASSSFLEALVEQMVNRTGGPGAPLSVKA